jgi:P-type Mg2+ transporter
MKQIESKCCSFLAECANLPIYLCLNKFKSSLNGLQQSQIEDIQTIYGSNILSTCKPKRWWNILLSCIPNPFNLLLSVLAIISIATQQTATFVILMIMVFISVGLRFWQEMKSNVAVNQLLRLVEDNVHVIRNGIISQVSKSFLVPGDIIQLRGGDVVPADVILVDTHGLYLSQSALTGETMPVMKQLLGQLETVESHSILDASNICFTGSTVVNGSALALVVAIGDSIFPINLKINNRYIHWLFIQIDLSEYG